MSTSTGFALALLDIDSFMLRVMWLLTFGMKYNASCRDAKL